MSLIKNISIGISSDSRNFTAETFRAAGALDALAASAAKMPSGTAGSFGSGGGGSSGSSATGGNDTGSILALGSQLRSVLTTALLPLNTLASRLSDQFNRVGGTITALARRIDAAIKFPATKRALDDLQAGLRSQLTTAAGTATASLTGLQRVTLALGPGADRAISAYRGFNSLATIFNSLTTRGDVARRPLDNLSKIRFDTPASGANLLANQFRTVAPVVGTATNAVKRFGVEIGLALGVFGLGFKVIQAGVGFLAGGIKGAMNLGETLSKTGEVFGASTASVIAQADEMARAFGLPKAAILDASSSFGLIAQGAGQSKEESAGLSKNMAQLAADASSFYNVSLETSLEKIRSGLVGEAEPLRAFGVLLSETAVKAEAHALGLAHGKGNLEEHVKVTARASLITKGLATASGDLARTQDSASNQFRRSGGGLQNFATSIGSVLIPSIQSGIGVFNELLASVVEVFEANRPMIQGWAETVKGSIEFAGSIIRNFGDYWQIAKISAIASVSNMLSYIETIPGNLAIIGQYVAGNWRELMVDGVNAVGRVFQNLGKNIGELAFSIFSFLSDPTGGFAFNWTPLLEGFKQTASQLPELLKPNLVSVDSEIASIEDRIATREQARAKGVAGLGRPDTAAEKATKDKGDKELKSAAAVELGSKEAGSAIAKFRNQASDDRPVKETARNTGSMAKDLKSTLAYLKGAKESGNKVSQAIAYL